MTRDDWRLTASFLLLGGLVLVILSQETVAFAVGRERLWLYLIAAVGVASFILGGRMAAGRSASPASLKPLIWLANKLNISAGQSFLLLLALCFALLASYAAGDLLQARTAVVSIVSWLAAIACAVAGTVRGAQDQPPRLERKEMLITAVIFGLALLLRGLAAENIPFTFSGDEGSAGLSAVKFAYGPDNNLFTVAWFDFPSLYFALQSVGILLFGQTVSALRLMSALGGALAVVAVYWLARSMFDVFLARLAALIMLASHYHIHMSRIALNNVWDSFFAATAAFGLWYGWKSGRRFGFVVCGLALGLGQYFYLTMRMLPLLFVLWAVVAWNFKRDRFRLRLPSLILAGYIGFIVFLPMAIYYSKYSYKYVARIIPVTVTSEWLTFQTSSSNMSVLQVIGQQLIKAAGGFVYEPLRLLYDPGAPLLLATAAALFLIGVIWALINIDLRYLLLLMPIVATIFIVSSSSDAPTSQRYVLATPFVAIIVAISLRLMTRWLQKMWPEYGRIAAIPALILLASLILIDLRFYFTQIYSDGYVLGGRNTEVASELANYLQEQESGQFVYFYGYPRMGYHSHGTIPYLVPHIAGRDVVPKEGTTKPVTIEGKSQFVFLPENLSDYQMVLLSYPEGKYDEFFTAEGELLFAVYEVDPAR